MKILNVIMNQNQPSMNKPLAAVKEDIKAQLLADLAQTEYARVLDRLAELSYQTPDTLVPIANALKLKIEQSEPFSRFGGETAISKNKAVIQAAFSHDSLDLGNNSEPIPLDNDSILVLRVQKHIPVLEKSLVEVKSLITKILALKKAEEKARSFGQKLLQQHDDEKQFNAMLAIRHLHWKEVNHVSRDADDVPREINELAFNLPKVHAVNGKEMSGDFVIASLKAVNDGELSTLDKEQIASITQQIEANYGVMDYDLYVRDLLNSAAIVKH